MATKQQHWQVGDRVAIRNGNMRRVSVGTVLEIAEHQWRPPMAIDDGLREIVDFGAWSDWVLLDRIFSSEDNAREAIDQGRVQGRVGYPQKRWAWCQPE